MIQAQVRAAMQPGPSAGPTIIDPTKAAMLKASSAVAALHVGSVVAQAEKWQTWDEEVGEVVRRLYYDSGFRQHFEGPGQMVEAMATFWWENRDLVVSLQDDLDAAVAEIARLRTALDPEVYRWQEVDKVWMMALTLATAGHPMSREDFQYYLAVAEAMALHQPIPDPPPHPSERLRR